MCWNIATSVGLVTKLLFDHTGLSAVQAAKIHETYLHLPRPLEADVMIHFGLISFSIDIVGTHYGMCGV